MSPRTHFALHAECLEDRTAPAFLRIVQDPGGITGFGTAGTDANNPSQTNSQFVTTAQLTLPFTPQTLGAVTDPIAASSTLTYDSSAPAGIFSTLNQTSGRDIYFAINSSLTKPAGLNGGGTTMYTYGLDPNVILAPLTIEVVADAGEQVGQSVNLSFSVRGNGVMPSTQAAGIRQDAGFTINGTRTSLLSRTVQAGQALPDVTNTLPATVKIGDRFQFDFTQSLNAAGIDATSGSAAMFLLLSVSSPALGAGVVGAGVGAGPAVKKYAPDGSEALSFFAFDQSFTGGVRVATGDVNNDGTADIIAGTGPGRATQVTIFDGKTGASLGSVSPFEASFTGGVFVASADVNGDGFADIAITPDQGGGPRVRIFDGKTLTPIADFLGIDDANFRGGARVAFGDLSGDGKPDLVVAAGFGGGPRIAIFDGTTTTSGTPTRAAPDFFVFEQTLRNGTFVAAGDIDGDGKGDLVVGGGPGGGPRVLALSGPELATGQLVQKANFFAGDPNNRSGVTVAVTDLDGDSKLDLVTGAGSGSRVTAYLGASIPTDGQPNVFRTLDAFPGTTGGVFVG